MKINLTATEQALYHELVSICNEAEWSEVFCCSNDQLRAALLISENTLISARLSLINAKLLHYKSGKSMRKFGQYSFIKPLTGSKFEVVSEVVSGVVSGVVSEVDSSDYNKQKPKVKPKHSDTNVSGAEDNFLLKAILKKKKKSPAAKKEKVTEHWQVLVDVWFTFYESKYNNKPTFAGKESKALESLLANLRKRSEAKGHEWNESTAKDTFTKFLEYAHTEKWLSSNFLLPNLNSQFDKIIATNGKGATTTGNKRDYSSLEQRLAASLGINTRENR